MNQIKGSRIKGIICTAALLSVFAGSQEAKANLAPGVNTEYYRLSLMQDATEAQDAAAAQEEAAKSETEAASEASQAAESEKEAGADEAAVEALESEGQDAAAAESEQEASAAEAEASEESAKAAEDAAAAAEAEKAAEEEDDTNQTNIDLQAGLLLSTGNSRNMSSNGQFNFLVKRGIHQGSGSVLGNYGISAGSPTDEWSQNVANLIGRLRYDIYVLPMLSVYFMDTALNDRFQGLQLRNNADVGLAYYPLKKKDHEVALEFGYDFQYDIREQTYIVETNTDMEIILNDEGNPTKILDRTLANNSLRFSVRYTNNLSKMVGFTTGLEYLQSVQVAKRLRLNYTAVVSFMLMEQLSINLNFILRYDNDPLPNVIKLDTNTGLTLAYRFI